MYLYIRKILMNFLYLISFIFVRNKRIWVFGSYGEFNDNSRYFFLYLLGNASVTPIWIAKNKKEYKEVLKYSSNCYMRFSLKGIYYSLRGGVYIYSSYVSDINFITSGGTFKVNLWHGIPLKKIEFDIKSGETAVVFDGSIKSRILYPRVYITPDILLSPCDFVSSYSFKRAFRVNDEEILVNTYPRVLNLLEKNKTYVKKDDKFIFLYAPTWRDIGGDFFSHSNLSLYEIDEFCLKNNCIFMIKLHSNTEINADGKNYKNIKILDTKMDGNEAMIVSDCLITDYSSIYFDYLYLKKPIIFFRFDEKEYISKNREFYEEIYKLPPGEIVLNKNELLVEMANVIKKGKENQSAYVLRKKLDICCISDNSSLYKKIKNKLDI